MKYSTRTWKSAVIADFSDQITNNSAKEFKESLEDLIATDRNVGLNFKEVEFIDSTGIGILVEINKSISQKKGPLAVFNLSEDIADLFEMSRISKVLKIFLTEKEFIDSINN